MSILSFVFRRKKKEGIQPIKVEELLNQYFKKNLDSFFIQIGSNNGVSNDPLHKHIVELNLNGILVEPIKYLFDELRTNYKNRSGLIFENVAISNASETKTFYRLKKTNDELPHWYEQLGSFNKEVILSHKNYIPNIEEYIIEDDVHSIPFKELLTRNNVKKVNLIHIDTEGYDYEIIKLIDFKTVSPDILIFEHKHLKTEDLKNCRAYLATQQYDLYYEDNDTVAVKKSLMKKL